MRLLAASEVLIGRDPAAHRFIGVRREIEPTEKEWGPAQAVLDGDAEALPSLLQGRMETGTTPLQLINDEMIPAITEVGERYNRGEYFLPQLMLSAEAMRRGFLFLKPHLARHESQPRGTVLLATVKNDIHDIGKNIVRVMCENNGWRVIDLGKDVGAPAVLEAVQNEPVTVVGLSALMTTTMVEMPEIIEALRQAGSTVPVMVGGAVVTGKFATEIGAHYASDAVSAVKLIDRLAKDEKLDPRS